MAKLKWNWLTVKDSYSSFYTQAGLRWGLAFALSIIPLVIGIATLLDLTVPRVVPLVFLSVPALLALWATVLPLLPRLHYLYGLTTRQADAIKWYEALNDKEKKQLPDGWDKFVREADTDEYRDNTGYYTSIPRVLHQEAQELIGLYRQSQKQAKISDYRFESYLQLMRERKEDLQLQIREHKDTEEQIALMD